jgi:SH3 domain protein
MNGLMRLLVPLCLLLAMTHASAGHYVTDKLLVGLYAKPDLEGEPVAVLTSGTPLEVLEHKDEAVQVRAPDGSSGWMEAGYVTEDKPATQALLEASAERKRLEEALEASRKELEQLRQGSLDDKLDEDETATASSTDMARRLATLEALNKQLQSRLDGVRAALEGRAVSPDSDTDESLPFTGIPPTWFLALAVATLVLGFIGGLLWVDRRQRRRHGGFRL